HVLRDHGAREHAPGVAEEVLEQRVLPRGEGDAPTAPRDLPRGGVQAEVEEPQGGRPLAGAAAQEGADPREELLEREGLGGGVGGGGWGSGGGGAGGVAPRRRRARTRARNSSNAKGLVR